MQAMAPGLRSEPQAGHFVGGPGGRDGGGSPPLGGRGSGGGGGGTCLPTFGSGIGKTVWHLGHRTCLPTEPSGTCSSIEHFGQSIICGIVSLTQALSYQLSAISFLPARHC